MRISVFVTAFLIFLVSSVAAADSPALQRIEESGVIRIGYVPDAPPMSFKDDDGVAVGYSIDLCKYVAAGVRDAVGLEKIDVEYIPLTLPEQRLSAIENGDIDIECGASTVTLSRRERVDFSLMTFITGGAVVALKSAPIPSLEDLHGKTIAVVNGTTTHHKLREFSDVNKVGFTLRIIENHDMGMELLDAEKVDGYATDRAMIIGQVLRAEDSGLYAISTDVFSFEPYALMLPRGDTEFRLVVDRALADLYRTARIRRLYHNWFGRYGEPLSPIVEAVYEFQAVDE